MIHLAKRSGRPICLLQILRPLKSKGASQYLPIAGGITSGLSLVAVEDARRAGAGAAERLIVLEYGEQSLSTI